VSTSATTISSIQATVTLKFGQEFVYERHDPSQFT
jgi:hypothetical protein